MKTLMNIAFGAMLAGASLGPVAWTDAAQASSRLVHVASVLAGLKKAEAPLGRAAATARAALPELPHGAR